MRVTYADCRLNWKEFFIFPQVNTNVWPVANNTTHFVSNDTMTKMSHGCFSTKSNTKWLSYQLQVAVNCIVNKKSSYPFIAYIIIYISIYLYEYTPIEGNF